MFEAVQHVVLVDNESDDGTADVAQQVAESVGAADRFTLASYPFRVSRAGAEHLATAAGLGALADVLLQLVVLARAHAATR